VSRITNAYSRFMSRLRYQLLMWLSPPEIKVDNNYCHQPVSERILDLNNHSETSIDAHFLWVSGTLSDLELLSLDSFRFFGYRVILWSYGIISNAPKYCICKNASEIISQENIFVSNNSYANFSDLFRYTLLNRYSGIWSDTDVICLSSAASIKQLFPDGFFVTEKTNKPGHLQINGNIFYNPNSSLLLQLCEQVSKRLPKDNLSWCSYGPALLTALYKLYGSDKHKILPPVFANPIQGPSTPFCLKDMNMPILSSRTYFLHCYNEHWRRAGSSKNLPFKESSLLMHLYRKFRHPQTSYSTYLD